MPKRKSDFFMSITFCLFVFISMGTKYAGLGFPQKDELSYTTGKLGLTDNVRNTKHLTLNGKEVKVSNQIFACGYSFFGNGRSSDCGNKFYDDYLNKQVVIGWYVQDRFLFFKNDLPQLVSLEVDNKTVISYEDTVQKIETKNKIYKFWLFMAPLLSMLFYFVLFKKITNDEIKKRDKRNSEIKS
ncbi:MAG: hypothetical protein J6N72_06625 [Psychrobacter sp.]|nr:hypothetical protein [Psychrobacter sp.]